MKKDLIKEVWQILVFVTYTKEKTETVFDMKKVATWLSCFVHIGFVLLLAVFNIEGMERILDWDDGTVKRSFETMNRFSEEDEGNKIKERAGKDVVSTSAIVNAVQVYDMNTEEKKVAYLTFDDGPSDNTDKILDVLKKKGVKATFFVVGKTGEKAKNRYRRIVEEGHTLGLHSFSHRYDEIYASLENFKDDVKKLRDYLYEVTGVKAWAYRFPGGSSNSVAKLNMKDCIAFLKEEGMVHYDWNASSEDAVSVGVSCSVLNENVLKDALRFRQPVILMHDLHECNNTADGLEMLIDRLKEEGYEMQAITKDTRPVQHVK